MKRTRNWSPAHRRIVEHAEQRGRQAFVESKPRNMCPYESPLRTHWLHGYDAAKREQERVAFRPGRGDPLATRELPALGVVS